jgi:LPXTG-site transpeptidase (sortase) family protein
MTLETGQRDSRRTGRRNRLSLIAMGAGVSALVAAGVLFVLTLTGTVGETGYSGPDTITGPVGDIRSVLTPQAPQPSPTVELPPASEAPVARIAIPRFEVDAPVVVRGVDANGVMETPNGPEDVAWYDFTARPGFGSNAVFSAHVDYINYGPAVFWNLKDLEMDDRIEVRLDDGTVYQYGVVAKDQIDAATANVGEIVGSTPREVVTLITCGGTFDSGTGQYDQRVIVRAERIYDEAPGQAQPGPAVLP